MKRTLVERLAKEVGGVVDAYINLEVRKGSDPIGTAARRIIAMVRRHDSRKGASR